MKNYPYPLLLTLFLMLSCGEKDGFRTLPTNDSSVWKLQKQTICSADEMVLSGRDAQAITADRYKNFILEFECKTTQGAVGAFQFHTDGDRKEVKGYEILINNNSEPTEWRKSGSISSIRNFAKCLAYNDEWVSFRIEVSDKNIKTYINGIFVTDYTEPEHPFRLPEYAQRTLSEGAFVFTNYTDFPISFRNIRVKTLDDNLVNTEGAQEEQNDDILCLSQQNFPTIDEHLHLKRGLTADDVETLTRKYGITYGIAPNCGMNFPITNDEQIHNWLDSMKHHLFLSSMQAEGREWMEMFSIEACRNFDYIFTDAMTWTDKKGRRMRIWIPEETFIDNKQQFMDLLVERACGIITSEPINIYVNPTFLPTPLQAEYDALWTNARMEKVIDACVSKNVAIEINCHHRIPSQKFIQMAKNKGVKFTMGTNNAGKNDVGKLEYAVEMIKACGLTIDDMWIPESRNR